MIAEAMLRDGTRALVLPLLPGDREAVRKGYETLSPEARRHRFLTGVPHLTEGMLDHLVDHVALVLVVLAGDDEGTPAASAPTSPSADVDAAFRAASRSRTRRWSCCTRPRRRWRA